MAVTSFVVGFGDAISFGLAESAREALSPGSSCQVIKDGFYSAGGLASSLVPIPGLGVAAAALKVGAVAVAGAATVVIKAIPATINAARILPRQLVADVMLASRTATSARPVSHAVVAGQGGVAAANSGRKVAIGEDMTNRVEPFAQRIGADTYKPDPAAPREMWLENNRDWIRKQMDDGCTIYDCGAAPGRANYPAATSEYYEMELVELKDYPNYVRVWMDE